MNLEELVAALGKPISADDFLIELKIASDREGVIQKIMGRGLTVEQIETEIDGAPTVGVKISLNAPGDPQRLARLINEDMSVSRELSMELDYMDLDGRAVSVKDRDIVLALYPKNSPPEQLAEYLQIIAEFMEPFKPDLMMAADPKQLTFNTEAALAAAEKAKSITDADSKLKRLAGKAIAGSAIEASDLNPAETRETEMNSPAGWSDRLNMEAYLDGRSPREAWGMSSRRLGINEPSNPPAQYNSYRPIINLDHKGFGRDDKPYSGGELPPGKIAALSGIISDLEWPLTASQPAQIPEEPIGPNKVVAATELKKHVSGIVDNLLPVTGESKLLKNQQVGAAYAMDVVKELLASKEMSDNTFSAAADLIRISDAMGALADKGEGNLKIPAVREAVIEVITEAFRNSKDISQSVDKHTGGRGLVEKFCNLATVVDTKAYKSEADKVAARLKPSVQTASR